jgi:hypothetical protein
MEGESSIAVTRNSKEERKGRRKGGWTMGIK